MPQPARRLDNLPDYAFSVISDEIREMAKQGIKVYRLDIGNPDLPPDKNVIDALYQSAQNDSHHGYSGYRGIARFREAIAKQYKKRFNLDLNPDTQILPLLGSKEGIVNLTLAYADQGDTILVPDIGYPSYAMGTRMAGGTVEWYRLNPDNNFLPDLSSISPDVAKQAKIMWINYPNNPTGTVATLDDFKPLLSFCHKYDIILASDNPYMDITYDGFVASSPLQLPDALSQTVEFYSFSKAYNMAGWRLGAAIASEDVIANLLRIKSNMDSGHFIPVYDAGIYALEEIDSSWISERNEIYKKRRDLILDTLPQIGLSANKSLASLYIWAYLENGDVNNYVQSARTNGHVSMAPGGIYGPGGEKYIRISVSVPDDDLVQALENLKSWYPTWNK